MKIRITSILLIIVTLLSCTLVGCGGGEDDDVDLVSSTTRAAVTLNFYIVTEDETTEEAKRLMQDAFNEVCESKYTTHVEFVFCTADEYEDELNAKYDRIEEINALAEAEQKRQKEIAKSLKAAGITTLKQKTTTSGTTLPETMKDTIGMTVLKYPSLLENQLDIVLITSREMLSNFADSGRLSGLNGNINGNNKLLKTYINDTLLNNAKLGGTWYGVPNNRVIGEYTYLLVNKEMATKYYYTEEDFVDFASCDELIELIHQYENPTNDPTKIAPVLGFADYPTVRYWSENGDRTILSTVYNTDSEIGYDSPAAVTNILMSAGYDAHMRQMFKYKENGYFAADADNCDNFGVGIVSGDYQLRNKYEDDYYTVILDYPRLEEEFTFSSMLAVSSFTRNLDRAMEIITDLNTDSELRNILQYGVEGTHFEIDENTGILKRLNRDYMMNIEYTGNVFMAYPEEGMSLDAWTYGKLQNMDSRVSITYGALENWGEVNTELMKKADAISAEYFKKLDQCRSVAEYEAWVNEVKTATGQDNSVFQKLFESTDREGEYVMTSPNGAVQSWYYTKYPLPD